MVDKDLARTIEYILTEVGRVRRYELTVPVGDDLQDIGREVLLTKIQQLQGQYGDILCNTPEGRYLTALQTHYQRRPGNQVQVDRTLLDRPLKELEISVRTYNGLSQMGVAYLGELVQRNEGEILRTKNMGRKCLREVKETLYGLGLSLDMKVDSYWTAPQGQ